MNESKYVNVIVIMKTCMYVGSYLFYKIFY
jgi:hypothetical protein